MVSGGERLHAKMAMQCDLAAMFNWEMSKKKEKNKHERIGLVGPHLQVFFYLWKYLTIWHMAWEQNTRPCGWLSMKWSKSHPYGTHDHA